MEFKGNELLLIVANQGTGIKVLDADGKLEAIYQNPASALGFIAAGGYVGIGHRKHIRYIRPEDPETARIPWASVTEMVLPMEDRRRGGPRHKTSYLIGKQGGNKQLSKAKIFTKLELAEVAERMEHAKFWVKMDPDQPWSEANSKPVW